MQPLVKIGELARRSGVPVATIKHYLREGLIAPTRKSGRTMSWYDPALVERLKAIKELQQRQFLPLEVIRETIDRNTEAADDLAAADAIAKVLARHGGSHERSREEILARGGNPRELAWLQAVGLAVPGADHRYRGDDLALLSTLAAARRAGLAAEMLPFSILERYLSALRALVAVEIELFRDGVLAKAKPEDVEHLATAATELSERLVMLLRRKLLLPTLAKLTPQERHEDSAHPPAVHRNHRVRNQRHRQQHGRPRRRVAG